MEPNQSTKRNVSPLLAIAFILTLGILAIPMLLSRKDSTTTQEVTTTKPTPVIVETSTPSEVVATPTKVKEFTVTGADFSFSPTSLSVNQGDTVIITFKNTDGIHDLTVDGYNTGTKQIAAGKEESIQFIASQKGEFEYYCSVGSHRKMGMVGTLTVL